VRMSVNPESLPAANLRLFIVFRLIADSAADFHQKNLLP